MRSGVLLGIIAVAVFVLGLGGAYALRATEVQPVAVRAESAPAPVLHPITVRKSAGPPRALTGKVDHAGLPVTVACSTCHATRTPDPSNHTTADLDLMHQGLQFRHGSNTCLSCHNPGDYDSLRLANGNALPFTEVMQLCAQCHGPQYRNWQHGSHGGMNGYWDLTRGDRTRNNCVDCHDPHAPKYVGAIPMPPPNDRFAPAMNSKDANHE